MRLALLILLPSIACTSVHAASARRVLDAVRAHQRSQGSAILEDYAKLLSIPNYARDLPGIERNVDAIGERLEGRGFQVTPWRLPDTPPLIFARRMRTGVKRTVAIYIHYDGQPVDESRWQQDPYAATLYDGETPRPLPAQGQPIDSEWRIYARSASDDKAPIAALTGALDALDKAKIPLTWNVLLFLDGEEEIGSPNLARYLDAHRSEVGEVDLWLFCDGPTHQSGLPQLSFGARGVTSMEVTVFGATRELHSGHYGNWAPVPGTELAHLLASMKGRDGAVRVKGFYDSHTPITEADRKAIATAPPVDAQLREELALHETEASNAPLGERLLLPALTIRGLASGDVGAKSRNAIPERAVATLGVRLAKGDDPEHMLDLLEDHIRAEGFHVVYDEPSREVRRAHPRVAMVTRRKGYRAVRTDSGDSRVQPVIQALRAVEPKIILNPTMGGSLPLYLFEDRSSAPIVILPIANHDNNQHAPNENLRIGNLWYGMDAYAVFLTR